MRRLRSERIARPLVPEVNVAKDELLSYVASYRIATHCAIAYYDSSQYFYILIA